MGQKKLQRFAEIKSFRNVFEYPVHMRGQWHTFFGNDHPVVLELACGKGEYAIGLGRLYHSKNFIGVDLKGNRIWVGAKKAIEEGLTNVAFIRSQIDKIDNYFVPGEVSEIWITFPDPQLRTSKAKKRLTHPLFLRLYQKILARGGQVHLKTDSPDLYNFTRTVLDLYGLALEEDNADVYASSAVTPELSIKTYYESLDIAKSSRVHYIRFQLPQEILVNKDEELKNILFEKEV